MTIRGSCLCGGVQFEIERVKGPSEICHCVRCQKKSGSTALETVYVEADALQIVAGVELIQEYSAPILNQPPAYTACFCSRCGSPVPSVSPNDAIVEIPSGLFDDDPGVQPERHIFVDFMPAWNRIRDSLPQLDLRALVKHRFGTDLPADYHAKDHQGRSKPA